MTPADAETGSKLGDQAIFVSDIVDRANVPDAKMTVGFARVGNREALDISFPYDSRGCERLASRASDDRNGRPGGVRAAERPVPASFSDCGRPSPGRATRAHVVRSERELGARGDVWICRRAEACGARRPPVCVHDHVTSRSPSLDTPPCVRRRNRRRWRPRSSRTAADAPTARTPRGGHCGPRSPGPTPGR